MLRPGKAGEAELLYIKYENEPGKWAPYKKILLEPVQVWKGEDTDLHRQHAEYLAKFLWSRLDEELAKDYPMTNLPGPGVLRIQAAITKTGKNLPMGDIQTTLPSNTRLIYEKQVWANSTESFIDTEVAAEMKVTDAETGELLGAAVDRRGGGKAAAKPATEWADVEEILTDWAKKSRWRFCTVRGGTNCEKP